MVERVKFQWISFLPYSDKRKQLLKMTFLVNDHNVSVIYIDINAIPLCFDLNILQQDAQNLDWKQKMLSPI